MSDVLPRALLNRALGKAIAIAQSPVAGYVARLRRARPGATPAEIVAVLEKQYLATVVPGIGSVAALALTGGETALFLETTALFALAVAEVHGIRVEEVERRRTLVLAVALGDNGAMLVEKMAGRGGRQWGALLPDAIPMSSITAINQTLGRWFLTRYGRRQGVLALGRIAPFGIGVAIGAAGNRAFGRVVVDTSRRVFGPPPVHFPGGSTVTTPSW